MEKKFIVLLITLMLSCISARTLNKDPCVYAKYRNAGNCRNGNLSGIPYEFFNDKKISSLDLGQNHISSDSLENLNDLKYAADIETLRLDHNNISHVPHNSFETLTGLKTLDLNYNHITYLSEWICHYSNIEEIQLLANPIQSASRDALTCHKGLKLDEDVRKKLMKMYDGTEEKRDTEAKRDSEEKRNPEQNRNTEEKSDTGESRDTEEKRELTESTNANRETKAVADQGRGRASIFYFPSALFIFILVVRDYLV